ncbi:YolD-like family protein [Oceanobacillus piezotolerans]|uniref:YolD-like family protein n=1 Tax=Oceanobacillus piezotolerans TaxID=2448030 RepID=A0A498DB76_9BACI|nr:YolD-like family protein [Oceanobacillus piezotolerans]RLL48251.1 YolD-like family protein [Oceanobacillus piezotolerans]
MPQDRGSIKWTSLMLPEHVALLRELWQEDLYVTKPLLDEQEIELIQYQLQEAQMNDFIIEIATYQRGFTVNYTGKIIQLEGNQASVRLQLEDGSNLSIPFTQVISVTVQ